MQDPGKPWVVGMDNLGEQVSDASRAQFLKGIPAMMPIFCPADCTDLVAVTDCDLGRMEKSHIRASFMADFELNPKKWSEDGISASDWRVKLTHWAGMARTFMYVEKSAMIVNAFKSCGFFNSMAGTEDKLIKIRGHFTVKLA